MNHTERLAEQRRAAARRAVAEMDPTEYRQAVAHAVAELRDPDSEANASMRGCVPGFCPPTPSTVMAQVVLDQAMLTPAWAYLVVALQEQGRSPWEVARAVHGAARTLGFEPMYE